MPSAKAAAARPISAPVSATATPSSRATIESKSNASRVDIETAVENIASAKHVFGERMRSGRVGDRLFKNSTHRPLGIGIFFTGPESLGAFTADVINALASVEPELRADALYLVGRSWISHKRAPPTLTEPMSLAYVSSRGKDVMIALGVLVSEHLRTWISPELELTDYVLVDDAGLDLSVYDFKIAPPISGQDSAAAP